MIFDTVIIRQETIWLAKNVREVDSLVRGYGWPVADRQGPLRRSWRDGGFFALPAEGTRVLPLAGSPLDPSPEA